VLIFSVDSIKQLKRIGIIGCLCFSVGCAIAPPENISLNFSRMPNTEVDRLPGAIQTCLTSGNYPVLKAECITNYSCHSSEFIKCDRLESGKSIPVSILSRTEIEEIFREALDFQYIDYQYIQGACYNRGQDLTLHLYLKQKQVFAGQVYIEGDFNFSENSWGMHTAPYVYLRDDEELSRVILDPAISKSKIVNEDEWISSFTTKADQVTLKEYHGALFLFSGKSERVSYAHPELKLDLLRSFKSLHESALRTGSAK